MGQMHSWLRVFARVCTLLTCVATNDLPHILLITTDQHRLDALSAYNNYIESSTGIKSPHIDKLASEGVKFLQAHATSPVCSPCRTSKFGLHQINRNCNYVSHVS